MRFHQPSAFYHYLSAPASSQSDRVFLVASSDDFERKKALDAAILSVHQPNALIDRFLGSEVSKLHILDALSSPMLLGGEPMVVVDEADKKLLDALCLWLKEPLSFGYLFLGSKVKPSASFFDLPCTILDLTEEKPWDKEKRLLQEMRDRASKEGKRLDPQAANLLLARLDGDSAVLAQELDKLILYCADRPQIMREDVLAIASSSKTHTLWQIADDLVWDRILSSAGTEVNDPSLFHSLLAVLRQQLMIGIKMHALHASQVAFAQWGPYFPKLKPKALEKKREAAMKLGAAYFRRGVDHLFELELLAKSGSMQNDALLDLFRLNLSEKVLHVR